MVGQDAFRRQPPEPREIGEVHIEALRFIDVRDRVLHRVSTEEQPLLGQPDDGRVVAVDVRVDQVELHAAGRQTQTIPEHPCGQYQWIDPGRSLVLTSFDRGLEPPEQVGGAFGCDDLAVLEGGGAGDVIEMPVAENNGELPHALVLEGLADVACMLDRDVRVVDDRLGISDHGVARDAERQRSVVHPVRALRKAIAINASVVEGENAFGGTKHAHVVHRRDANAAIASLALRAKAARGNAYMDAPKAAALDEKQWF